MEENPRTLDDPTQSSLLRYVSVGIILGMVGFAVISTIIMRIAQPDSSWQTSLAVGGFGGLWAGLFFGSAGGVGAWGLRHEH